MKFLAMTVFCVDFFNSTGEVFVGGNSLNFAVQCAKSGISDISLLGAIGDDTYGNLIKDYIRPFGFDASHLHTLTGRTASNRIYNDENGDRYFMSDSWDGGVYGTFRLSEDDWNFAADFDVIAMPANNPNYPELLKRKTSRNRLAVDFLDLRDYGLIEKSLPCLDLLFISGDEAVIEKLVPMSLSTAATLVVTLGSHGSAAISTGRVYRTAAVSVDSIVDTTGCGDAYIAAFCADRYRGGSIESSMLAGSQAASKVLAWRGGVENGLMAVLP
ncbi:MAG TPA: PfkB family carbohydrate kinase [Clostridia bacterium]|nr:PfkB family carbohydrate kinase [Clostridia bacterium]